MTLVIIMKFKIADGREKEFEDLVAERARLHKKASGFKVMYLLVPVGTKEFRLVSWWDRLPDHEAWIRKESYELGHNAQHQGLVIGTVPHEVGEIVRQW